MCWKFQELANSTRNQRTWKVSGRKSLRAYLNNMWAREKLPALSESAMNSHFVSFHLLRIPISSQSVTCIHFQSQFVQRGFTLYAGIEGRVSFAVKSAAAGKRTIDNMDKNDFNSDPLNQTDPLSATGMFLNSFGSTPPQEASDTDVAKSLEATSGPGATRTDWPPPSAAPASPVPPPSGSGPGEFTQIFQAMEQRQGRPPLSQQPPASPTVPAPSQGPGEFTRIFVSGSTPSTEQKSSEPKISEPKISEQRARTVVEPPLITPPASNPSRMKGFSTPGVSDSASAEGSFTQFFKASPAAPASMPSSAPPVQSYKPSTPTPPPPLVEKPWQREPEFDSITKPADASPSSPSATGLLSALSNPAMSPSAPRQPEVTPYRPEPLPSYTPTPPPVESSTMEAGSVTKLIQRLSQVPREAPRETPQAHVTPAAVASAPPQMNSSLGEPGEFTRMISGDTVKAALGAAPAVPAAQPAPAAAPPIAMPHLAVPAIPAIAPPAIPVAKAAAPPKLELPKIAPPAAPVFAAPKSKLEAMVPILLVINTFLLVVLLVVVIFALKAK
jgi:hypothetical protein